MRLPFALLLLLPSLAHAQPTAEQKKATAKWVTALQAADGGFLSEPQEPGSDAIRLPSLSATNAAVRTLKYLGAAVPNQEKHAAFVLACFDPETGGFGQVPRHGKPDVAGTSAGVMAATELGVPKKKFAKAMDYIKENAKTFEDVRIGAAAVEAWGVKDCPFELDEWFKIANEFGNRPAEEPKNGGARGAGSLVAMWLRLGRTLPARQNVLGLLTAGQRADGGWGKAGAKASDLESTYRVMRALMLLKEKPKDVKKLRAYLDAHRNADGGYGTKPGDPSTVSAVYYCTVVSKWLDEMSP
jgi:prenyltransferase beta subunit